MTEKIIEPKKIGFFSDLDQTLLYSSNSIGITGHTSEWPDLVVAEIYHDKPFGFMTYSAALLLKEFSNEFNFVPTTTRTTKQYKRISVPRLEHSYAITTNGAKILHNGEEDQDWTTHIKNNVLSESESVSVIYNTFKEEIDNADWVVMYKNVDDLFGFFVFNPLTIPQSFIERVQELSEQWNFTCSIQGKKMYLVPKNLTKGKAVTELTNRLGLEEVIAAGDSNLDKSILELVNYPIRPSHGELHKNGYEIPGLVKTTQTGVLAGEEIIHLALQKAYRLSGE
jgi:hydroxymethylpyrimidine pyrophosphatase-like HAD family hydrolase